MDFIALSVSEQHHRDGQEVSGYIQMREKWQRKNCLKYEKKKYIRNRMIVIKN